MNHAQFVYRSDSRQSPRSVIPLLGALTSLLLHALLLAPVLLGGTAQKPKSSDSQYLGSAEEATDASSMELVFVEAADSTATRSREADAPAPSMPALSTPTLSAVRAYVVPEAVISPAVDDSDDRSDTASATREASAGDPSKALMFGRYVGQIDARIQRAWLKPRAQIASGLFACRVRIVQEHDGRVREIEIEGCNDDLAWQGSLVQAIQSASPLPAPPDPTVFSRVLTLDFTAQPFEAGADPEGFQPELRTATK